MSPLPLSDFIPSMNPFTLSGDNDCDWMLPTYYPADQKMSIFNYQNKIMPYKCFMIHQY